jgi:hypothetical protein
MKSWKQEEIEYLKKNYSVLSVANIASNLNRTKESIIKKARKIKLLSSFYWNAKEIEYIKSNYGIISIDIMASTLCRSIDQIKYKLKKMRLFKKEKNKWNKEDNDFLITNFATILPEEAESKLKRKWEVICNHSNKLGLKRSESIIKKMHSISNIGNGKIYSINSEYFNVLNEDNAYILGLLATDGCMHKRLGRETYSVSLGLNNKDRYIIENINQKMNSTYTIYDRKNEIASVVIRDQKICRRLLELGIVPRKSLILECPKIPLNTIPSFIRGVIDGDGTIQVKKPKVRIYSGSQNFVNGIQELLNEIGINSKIYVSKAHKNPSYILTINRISDMTRLYSLMYSSDSNLFLVRKKERFDTIYKKYVIGDKNGS